MAGPFNTQTDYYNAAAQNAVPSPESLDRAAARLRSRVDTQGVANQQALNDQYAGRGTTAGGGYNNAMMRNYANTQNAYSQGYGQLQDDYVKQQQAGAGILAGIGNQIGDQTLQGRGLDIQQLLGQGNLDVQRQKITTDDQLQRYLQGNQLNLEREQLAQQGSQFGQQHQLAQQQFEQQRQEALRGSLMEYFNSMAQGGNTSFNNPANQQMFGDLQQRIMQALGGGGGGVPNAPAPAPGPAFPPNGGPLPVSGTLPEKTVPNVNIGFGGGRAAY